MSHVHLPAMPLCMLCTLVWRSAPHVLISSYASEWRGCSPLFKTANSIFSLGVHVIFYQRPTCLSSGYTMSELFCTSPFLHATASRCAMKRCVDPKMLHQLHKTTAHALAQQQHKHWQFSSSNQGFSCWPTVRPYSLPAVDICSGSRNLKSAE